MPSIPDDRARADLDDLCRAERRRRSGCPNRSLLATAFGLLVVLLALIFVPLDGPMAKSGFVPQTSEQRAAALGSTASLEPVLKKALETSDGFAPKGKPKPSEWLAEHIETGQTFDAFVRSNPNRPDAKRNRIYLLPIGKFDAEWSPKFQDLSDCCRAFFQMEIRVLDGIPLDPKAVKSRPRTGYSQYLTTDLLQVLRTQLPEDGFCILGVTMEDLYPDPRWNYVFGQASLRDRVGVYSFARYDPAFWGEKRTPEARKLLLGRCCGVLVHETCHMFGMAHCIYYECVVNGSNSLTESDQQPLHLCPICLRKLQHSTGFDVIKRYEALRAVYGRLEIDETEWIDARLKVLRR